MTSSLYRDSRGAGTTVTDLKFSYCDSLVMGWMLGIQELRGVVAVLRTPLAGAGGEIGRDVGCSADALTD